MPLNLDLSVSLVEPDVKQYLNDDNVAEYEIKAEIPTGFQHSAGDVRPSLNVDGTAASAEVDAMFLARETYRLITQGSATGTHHVVVALGHTLDVSVTFALALRTGLDAQGAAHARHLLKSFDPAVHGPDLEEWVSANLDGKLTDADFELVPSARLLKRYSAPREIDVSQRAALFQLMGMPTGSTVESQILVGNMDMGLDRWAQERRAELRLVGRQVILTDDGSAGSNDNVREVPNPNDPAAAQQFIDDLVDPFVEADCGVMRAQQIKLLTVGGWPEFKIEWVRKTIKIGCAKIRISVPRLYVRECRLVFYAYYKMPQDVGQFVFRIAEVCAVRSALTSAVIGAITSNIAAAIASFTPLFKRCMENEILKCLHPGLMLLKERSKWRPA